ncbi:unnamed protein product [Periconia digitata]|uniref:Nucleoside transporter family n=1 Tax=Periconia digitata TaxID=1303443 RepID=A0A9W4XMJ5_9PLEO|nr:unnamed protein product [Periconia digitata]
MRTLWWGCTAAGVDDEGRTANQRLASQRQLLDARGLLSQSHPDSLTAHRLCKSCIPTRRLYKFCFSLCTWTGISSNPLVSILNPRPRIGLSFTSLAFAFRRRSHHHSLPAIMDRIRNIFQRELSEASYEPLQGGSEREDGEEIEQSKQADFSWIDYSVFLLLGIAMLWAWNMFLAAAPYFQQRFESDERLLRNFQPVELVVSTLGNLGSMLVLTKLQAHASYPTRIIGSLVLNAAVFALLAMSTRVFPAATATGYFAFFVIVVFAASWATALCQNGVFAYASGFGIPEYTQAIMTGQGIAGVLPCITQIVSVLSVPAKTDGHDAPKQSSTSAFVYFLTATVISSVTMLAFFYLLSRHSSRERIKQVLDQDDGVPVSDIPERKAVPLTTLFNKLYWLALAVFLDFALTMFYPVFTQQILSVRDPATAPRLFHPATFIPLGFLIWNVGDLLGRMLPSVPALSLTMRPRLVFFLTVGRIVFIPIYFMCNLGGEGAVVNSDVFYLFVVQFFFGASNGFIGTTCMMGKAEWVDEDEQEAAGGFMSLCLVAGLAVGSFLSFLVA